jgi:hypothetical protein
VIIAKNVINQRQTLYRTEVNFFDHWLVHNKLLLRASASVKYSEHG